MRTKPAKGDLLKYEHHKVSSSFGAGPLRARKIRAKSHGRCTSCGIQDNLWDGLCDWCLWMTNDLEAGEDFYK